MWRRLHSSQGGNVWSRLEQKSKSSYQYIDHDNSILVLFQQTREGVPPKAPPSSPSGTKIRRIGQVRSQSILAPIRTVYIFKIQHRYSNPLFVCLLSLKAHCHSGSVINTITTLTIVTKHHQVHKGAGTSETPGQTKEELSANDTSRHPKVPKIGPNHGCQ